MLPERLSAGQFLRRAGPNGTGSTADRAPVLEGDNGSLPDMASRVTRDSQRHLRLSRPRPWASINLVTAHDGFQLHDLVSYETKHNEPTARPTTTASAQFQLELRVSRARATTRLSVTLRDRQKRNLMATLLLSLGVPMLLAGDEFGAGPKGATTTPIARTTNLWLDWQTNPGGRQALRRFGVT